MNPLPFTFLVMLASVAGALDFAPTKVLAPLIKTVPPSSDGGNEQYVETVYKATDHQTMVHTIEPLQPSYEVKYLSTSLTTVNNQTITTSSVEFATVLNTTILFNSEALWNYTYNGAPTEYQTLEFATQKVRYTPLTTTFAKTGDPVTTTEYNAIPFV